MNFQHDIAIVGACLSFRAAVECAGEADVATVIKILQKRLRKLLAKSSQG